MKKIYEKPEITVTCFCSESTVMVSGNSTPTEHGIGIYESINYSKLT